MIAFLIGLVVCIPLILGVYWLIWSAWCWALPQLWPTGPVGLIEPGYWLFVVSLLLLSLIGKTIFGGSKKE